MGTARVRLELSEYLINLLYYKAIEWPPLKGSPLERFLREIGAQSIVCACGRMLTKPAEVANEKLAVVQHIGRTHVFGGARMADLPGRLCPRCFHLSGP